MPRAPDRSGTSEAHASTAPPGALPHALVARLAALLFFLGGLIGLVVDLAVDGPGPGAIQTALGPAAMATGAVAWFCPWERWPRLATFWPVPVALALIATGATFGGMDPHAYGAFFTLIFTWLGMTQPRWTSLRFAVPAAVFYAIPFLAGGRPASELISVAQVIPICALVGEAVAWVADRLRRREEELRDALRVKSDFLTMTSHELRTPLVPVLGFASSMLSKWDVAKEQEKLDYLHRIDRNARVLQRMVENLIAMSSMEAGGGSLPEVVDVGEIIQRTLGEFREEGHIIDITCPPGIGVVADRDHLRLVLSNFVANALPTAPLHSRSPCRSTRTGPISPWPTAGRAFRRSSSPTCSRNSLGRASPGRRPEEDWDSAFRWRGRWLWSRAVKPGTSRTSRVDRASACDCGEPTSTSGRDPSRRLGGAPDTGGTKSAPPHPIGGRHPRTLLRRDSLGLGAGVPT